MSKPTRKKKAVTVEVQFRFLLGLSHFWQCGQSCIELVQNWPDLQDKKENDKEKRRKKNTNSVVNGNLPTVMFNRVFSPCHKFDRFSNLESHTLTAAGKWLGYRKPHTIVHAAIG